MDLTVENLERAVSQFYHSGSSHQAEAHKWLTEVQLSPNAWPVIWELLQPTRSGEAQFFAATTLHLKLMKNWSEVPTDQYTTLKNKLLETILQYSVGPKLVLNRLCIALSAYLIQTTPHYWPNSLEELILMFQPEGFPNIAPARTLWMLLEVLTVIPEEFQTMTLSQKHKASVKKELEKAVPKVVQLIEDVLDWGDLGGGSSNEVTEQAAQTAVAWLYMGVPLPSCLPLAAKLVKTASSMSMSDPMECCEHVMEALSQMCTHPNTHRFPLEVLNLLNIILPLREIIEKTDNRELMVNIYRLFVAFAENHSRLVLDLLARREPGPTSSAQQLIGVVVACTASPGIYPVQEKHSQLTFGFWYVLQDEMSTMTKENARAAKEVLVPIYEQVCQVLLRKSQHPSDSGERAITLSAADAEAFRCYRQDIADTMVYCYYVVRDFMLDMLESALRNAATWQEAEAILHVAFAIAEATGPEDDGRVVNLLASVPTHLVNSRIVNAHNQAVGAYAEWFSGHGDVLGRLMPSLVQSMQSVETATSATMAIKDITRECTVSIKPYAEPLLVACQDALAKGHLRPNECVRLMYSVGRLLSILDYDKMMSLIEPLVLNYTSSIEQLLSQEVSAQVKSGLVLRLRMLSTLCATLYLDDGIVTSTDPPALLVLDRLLPLLVLVAQKWAPDSFVIQEVCSCVKSGVSSLVDKCEPLMPSILSLVVSCYTAQPNVVALEVVRQIVLLFGGSVEVVGNSLVTVLVHSVTATTMLLVSQREAAASEASDVVQAFFVLLTAIAKRNLNLLACSYDMAQLFRFGIASLTLPEQSTVKAASGFLCTVIIQSRDQSVLVSVVPDNGEHLVHTVLTCIGGDSPRSVLDSFAEILLCLNKKYCDSLSRWLTSVMSIPDFPTNHPAPEAKANFSRMVLRERANKRKLQDTVKEFAFICRGIVNTGSHTLAATALH